MVANDENDSTPVASGDSRNDDDITPDKKSENLSLAGLASGLTPQVGKGRFIKEITPVAIRRGYSGGLIPGAAARANNAGKFVPNVRPSFLPSPAARRVKSEGGSAGSRPGDENDDSTARLDIGAALAHSLALRRLQEGGRKDDVNLRRGTGGAFGARATGKSNKLWHWWNHSDGRRSNSSTQAKVQQHLQNIRRAKKGKKSKDVSELSWATGPGGVPMYTPISLPYVAVDTGEELEDPGASESESQSVYGPRTKRPTSRHIDEFNRHASSLFAPPDDDEGGDQGHQWLLVQFPTVLPALEKTGAAVASAPSASSSSDNYQATEFSGLPEGFLGKLMIHKSGHVRFVSGNHHFQVNQGADCNFSQEIACLIQDNAELMFLGKCDRRVVLTPEIRHYIT